ncbi:MAG: hypothetical protein DRJ51_04490 [Thermoprotei archaeon]|nr:MAG: hypothetical protein DRJ51_04490 [Thermoprotei archaeon]
MSVIRVSEETYNELKKLKRKVGAKSMAELISLLVRISKEKIDEFHGAPATFLRTLKFASEAGEYDSERVDELLYGEKS